MNTQAIADLFALTDRELWLVTARAGDRAGGCIATFVSQASIVPGLPRVLLGIAHHHFTGELIKASGAFALHLIGEQHLDWVWQFGAQSGRQLDKLNGVRVSKAATGSPILSDALGWLDCRVEARLDTGDRTVYLADACDGHQASGEQPLTLKRMLQLAPPEKKRQLRDQFDHDAALDAVAIRAWRERLTSAGQA